MAEVLQKRVAFRESSHTDSYVDAERLLKRRQGEIVVGKFCGLEPERIRFAAVQALMMSAPG